jgi:hypothetical protein
MPETFSPQEKPNLEKLEAEKSIKSAIERAKLLHDKGDIEEAGDILQEAIELADKHDLGELYAEIVELQDELEL